MRNLFIIVLLLIPFSCFSQSKKTYEKFKNYRDSSYFIIEDENIVVSRIIENINRDKQDLYLKVKEYFVNTYPDVNNFIQLDDRDSGKLIGKDCFTNLFSSGIPLLNLKWYHCCYTLQVDIKDGRARVICYAREMILDDDGFESTYIITNYFPFVDKRFNNKGAQAKAFLNLIDMMQDLVNGLEDFLTIKAPVSEEEW